jgi:acetyl-CoA synthetase
VVAAFVRPRAGLPADETLAEALKAHVRARLAPYKAPRLVRFVEDFPMTSSGKINRRALRDRWSAMGEQP